MTIELYDAVNGDGLFNVQGKAFHALATLNTARLTTVPVVVEDFLEQFNLRSDAEDLDLAEAMEGLNAAVKSWQSAGNSLATSIRSNLQNLLVQIVVADAAQPERSLRWCLEYVIAQMVANGDYVDGNTVGLTLTAAAGNHGSLAICYTAVRGDGKTQENAIVETLQLEVTTQGSLPTIQIRGMEAQTNRLAHDWPKGSGCNVSITATDPGASLLTNGDFEDVTNAAADDWILQVGTWGTSAVITAEEQQTVTIAGTPTGGTYVLQWTDNGGITRSTTPLAYNASGATVQAALRWLPGLEAVTVSSTGTSPNYVHTVTFTGTPGAPAQLTSVSALTGGSPTVAHATTVAGTAGAYRGRALGLVSTGSEVTALYHALPDLEVETVYFLHARIYRYTGVAPTTTTAAPTTTEAPAGVLKFEIMDEIGGNVLNDSAGTANALTINAGEMSDVGHLSHWFAFRLPQDARQPVYLRVRISTAFASGETVYIDEIAIVAGTRLYAGGPYVACFPGVSEDVLEDSWTLAVANNRGGSLQEWYNRVYGMADLDLLLPVSGSNAIPDSVIG